MKLYRRPFLRMLGVCVLAVPALVHANSFDDAVNEYIKGFKECTEANTLRADNLVEAKRKFASYLRHLERATAIDPTILTSTQRDMDSNLRYCERVEVNLKRAEATPILEQGFVRCDASQQALKEGDVQTAQAKMTEYKGYLDQALGITDSLMDVFALASKVRACARYEEKLDLALEQDAALVAQMNQTISGYQRFIDLCQQAQAAIASPKFTLARLDAVNELMNQAGRAKQSARQQNAALAELKANPQRPESQQLHALLDQAAQCEGKTSDYIRTATRNRRALEQEINQGVAGLRSAQTACETAQRLGAEIQSADDLALAEAEYNRSAELKRRGTGNAKLLATVKQFATWSASRDFSELMNSTERCQQIAATRIKEQKVALAKRQQLSQEEAERQARLAREQEQERQRKAQQAAAEAERQAAEQRAREAARRQAEAEAEQAASLEDVPDDPLFEDDEFADFEDEDEDKLGRSWTDLVR